MSTLRVSNIEAKADASSPTINEKVKITNSNGDVMLQLDGATSGITTVGINTTTAAFTVDGNQNFNFVGIVTAASFSGNLTGDATGLSGSPTLTGITSISTTNLTVNGNAYPSAGPLSNRNKIINGDMRIDQRNVGAAVTASGDFPVDRFAVTNSTDGVFSAQQDSSAPVGFSSSTKITITTADASVTGTQGMWFRQFVEGLNIYDLSWGTANAKTVTLSFWVRSSVTGTFGGSIGNSANDRYYPFSYSISSADTWEQKTITIAGETTGTWLTTTGIGLRVYFSLAAGPDRVGTTNQWNTDIDLGATGQTQLVGTLNATWYITGVQLEVGSVATPFEYRSYGDELARCQRYYAKTYDQGTVPGTSTRNGCIGSTAETTHAYASAGTWQFPVTMREAPTVLLYSTETGTLGQIAADGTDGAGVADNISDRNAFIHRNNSSSGVVQNAYIRVQATASAEF